MAKLNVEIPAVNVKVDGVEYRKVDRKAQAGDIVKALRNGPGYRSGEYFAIQKRAGVCFVDNDGDIRWVPLSIGGEFEVYEKVIVAEPEPSSDIITHGGRQYRKVARMAKVGEMVIITKSDTFKRLVGAVLTAVRMGGFAPIADDGSSLFSPHTDGDTKEDYRVLVPVTSAETEIKRNANAGERIRIVDAKLALGYKNGDVLTVEDTSNSSGVFVTNSEGERCGVWHSEYVVLTEETPEPAASPRLKVGEYVRVVSDVSIRGNKRSDVRLGEIYEIIEVDGGRAPYRGKRVSGGFITWFRADAVVRATDAEVAEAKAEMVRKAKEAEESAKWAAIGRKPNEYKAGDIVVCTGSSCGHPVGTIGELEYCYTFSKLRVKANGELMSHTGQMRLVTPVEQRFDRDSRFDRK